MPELGEVQHAVSLLRKNILGKTIAKVSAPSDNLLYVAPLTGEQLASNLQNSTVSAVGRNGKYFWLELDKKATMLMHFGMTGWVNLRNVQSHMVFMEGGGDKKQKQRMEELLAEGKDPSEAKWEMHEWPPKYTKFSFETAEGDDFAFSDPRRLGRVRWFDCGAENIDQYEPISKLGKDFSQEEVPVEEIVAQIKRRKVPLKSLLLDQSVFSGIGNWMGDEILFQARLHPEQVASTLDDENAANLYSKVLEVCRTAAELEGNSAAFPKTWLMLHRWGKSRSKKETQKTPDGYKVDFVTVGGRTSCYVPKLQKKLKPAKTEVKDEIKNEADDGEVKDEVKEKAPAKKKRKS